MISATLASEQPSQTGPAARPASLSPASQPTVHQHGRSALTFRVGFIGAGFIADWHAKAIRNLPQVDLVAICDRHEGRCDALADQFGISQRYTDWNEMLAAESLDAVHILLPPHLHFAAARDALELGVDVLVEKPLGVNVQEVEDLVHLAQFEGALACRRT